jgi:hypothetical protein
MAYELFVRATEDAPKMAIVSFAGSAEGIGRIPLFEFQRFLETTCPKYDKFFYHDVKRRWSLTGASSYRPKTSSAKTDWNHAMPVRIMLVVVNNNMDFHDGILLVNGPT